LFPASALAVTRKDLPHLALLVLKELSMMEFQNEETKKQRRKLSTSYFAKVVEKELRRYDE
jgi:hypothetical protein